MKDCKACAAIDAQVAEHEEVIDKPDRFSHTCGQEWPRYVNAYEVNQAYGGREEGGWWFDVGEPLESVRVDNQEELDATLTRLRTRYELDENGRFKPSDPDDFVGNRQRARGRTSAAGGYDISVCVQEHFARPFPEERPRYE